MFVPPVASERKRVLSPILPFVQKRKAFFCLFRSSLLSESVFYCQFCFSLRSDVHFLVRSTHRLGAKYVFYAQSCILHCEAVTFLIVLLVSMVRNRVLYLILHFSQLRKAFFYYFIRFRGEKSYFISDSAFLVIKKDIFYVTSGLFRTRVSHYKLLYEFICLSRITYFIWQSASSISFLLQGCPSIPPMLSHSF